MSALPEYTPYSVAGASWRTIASPRSRSDCSEPSVWTMLKASVSRSVTAAAGKTAPITEWPLTRDLIIAETDKKARELAEEHIMVAYRREYAGGWRHPFIDASIATDLDRLMADRFLIGGPDQVIPKIRTFVEAYGMTHLICRTFFPGMPHAHIMRTLELLAREVMPAFK